MNVADISISDTLHLLEIVALVGGGLRVSYSMGRTHKAIEASIKEQQVLATQQSAEIDDLKTEIRGINNVLKEVAVQDNRLDRLENDVADLRRGQGLSVETWGSVLESAIGRGIARAVAGGQLAQPS